MAVDFHTHLQDMSVDLSEFSDSSVYPFVSGYSHKGNVLALELYREYGFPFFIGIAPQEAQNTPLNEIDKHLLFVEKNAIFGIGEIGMDFHWGNSEDKRKLQLYTFEKQLEIAEELSLPVVLHTRKAEDFVVELLIRRGFSQKVVFHFYSGKISTTRKAYENLDCYFSIVPFPSKERKKLLQEIPLKRIVVETDSPYAGKTPYDVFKSIEYVARIKEISSIEVEEQTALNSYSIIKK